MLWAELCSPPHAYVGALISECDCFGREVLYRSDEGTMRSHGGQ